MLVRELLTKIGFDSKEALKNAKNFDNTVISVKKTLFAVTAASVAAGASLFGISRSTAKAADSVAKLRDVTGIGSDTLQGLAHGAEMAGVNAAALNVSLTAFTRRVGAAAKGTGPAVKSLQDLGISVLDAGGKLRNTEAILFDVADAFSRIDDEATRAEIAQQLFNETGRKLGVLFAQGSDGIRGYVNDLDDLGNLLSKDTLESAVKFQDESHRLNIALAGLKNTIGAELLPVMTEAITNTLDWFKANRNVIRQNLSLVVSGIVTAFRAFKNIIGGVVDGLGGFERAMRAIVSLVLAFTGLKIIGWLGRLAVAIKGAATALVAMRIAMFKIPLIGWALALAAIIEDIIAFRSGADSLTGVLLNKLKPAVDFLKNSFENLMEFLQPAFDLLNNIGGAIKNIPSFVGNLNPFVNQPQAAFAGGNLSPSMNVTENITLNVPAGTTQEQASSIGRQVRREVKGVLESQYREALNNFPEVE